MRSVEEVSAGVINQHSHFNPGVNVIKTLPTDNLIKEYMLKYVGQHPILFGRGTRDIEILAETTSDYYDDEEYSEVPEFYFEIAKEVLDEVKDIIKGDV